LAVYTGNMGLKQDLGNLVDAARFLTRSLSSVRVVLVGDGSQRCALEAQAQGLWNVRFTGLVDEQLYPVVLAAADVLVVNERASVGEMSLPSKLTSYLAAGRPILAAVAHGGASHRELMSTGGAACIVSPSEPARLAAALSALAEDSAAREAMGAAAARYAARNLSSESSLETLLGLLTRSAEPQVR